MRRTIKELNNDLDTKKFPTRQDMRDAVWDYREVVEELIREYQRLVNKVNKVTAPYRHGAEVTNKALTELSNRQIDVEKAVNKLKG